MSGEAGGWMWILIDVAAVVILGAALVYGIAVWKTRRSRAADAVRDLKTEELHRRPDPDEPALGSKR